MSSYFSHDLPISGRRLVQVSTFPRTVYVASRKIGDGFYEDGLEMTPLKARRLAHLLLDAANVVEGYEPEWLHG